MSIWIFSKRKKYFDVHIDVIVLNFIYLNNSRFISSSIIQFKTANQKVCTMIDVKIMIFNTF